MTPNHGVQVHLAREAARTEHPARTPPPTQREASLGIAKIHAPHAIPHGQRDPSTGIGTGHRHVDLGKVAIRSPCASRPKHRDQPHHGPRTQRTKHGQP